jgi:hypothetical protein
LVRRFCRPTGRPRPDKFARWLGAPAGWAASAFAAQRDLAEVSFEGKRTWVNAGNGRSSGEIETLQPLPYFDSYLIAGHPRAALFPGAPAGRALNGGQAGNVPAVLIGGRVGGV